MEVNIRRARLLGKVRKVLVSKKIEGVDANYVGVELCETVHFHLPGFRWETTLAQLEKFAEILGRAVANWKLMGSPKPDGDDFKLLADGYLPGEPVYNTRFEIEEQTIPLIHLHVRGLNLRWSIPTFKEYARLFGVASENFSK